MTFVSVAQASARLGIDAKTLHRWLAQAQLPLQSHPCDGRKKGVSSEYLERLAHLHHRHLACSPGQVPALLPSQMMALPADLLKLPERLSAMQAQLAALQKQVADLTQLMTQPRPEPAIQLPSTKPTSTAKPAKKPARSAPSSPPAGAAFAKTPKKPVHVIPRVEYSEDGHYVVICPKRGVLPFEPDTQEWFAWVAEQESFRFVGKEGHFTAHHWWRVRKKGAWRAHRHIRNRVHSLRLAPNHELTSAVLEQAAQALSAHLQ